MLSLLQSVGEGILNVPYGITNLLVAMLNVLIVGLSGAASAALSLLPSFPEAPSAPSGVVGALLWFFPLGTVLSFFGLMVTAWITWLGVKVILKWAKVV